MNELIALKKILKDDTANSMIVGTVVAKERHFVTVLSLLGKYEVLLPDNMLVNVGQRVLVHQGAIIAVLDTSVLEVFV